jgi:hypothetical protein
MKNTDAINFNLFKLLKKKKIRTPLEKEFIIIE